MAEYKVGWGQGDITPQGAPSSLEGQFNVRITQEVKDPLLATCMYVESSKTTSMWVSCDANHIFKSLTEQVEGLLAQKLEGFKPEMLMLCATHIHTGPYHERGGWLSLTGNTSDDFGAMKANEYRSQMAEGIVKAVLEAKKSLEEVTVELAIAPVITGVNRRVVYSDGRAKMYGSLEEEDFSQMEGRDGGPTQLLYVYTAKDHQLTGVVANVPCSAQCDEFANYITADYWGVVRKKLHEKWTLKGNKKVFLLPLIRASGDISPHPMADKIPGEEAYEKGPLCAKRMGEWVADVIEMFQTRPLRTLTGEVHGHVSRDFTLPVWQVNQKEYEEARAYLEDKRNYDDDGSPVNTFDYANAWTRVRRVEKDEKRVLTRVQATRLDEVVLVSMPFEVYIAYADRIRSRIGNKALLFDVELTYDNLGYLPTRKALSGGHYSANIFNGVCDAKGGDEFVEICVDIIQSLFNNQTNFK